MVTAQLGTLTSQNAGDGTTSTSAQRVLVDFKDALVDYKTTSLDAISMFCEPMTTDTGGDIDITIAKPSMAMEEIEEGTTPAYQHTSLRNERVSVKEWGIAVAVTRRMIEDSRFNEVELALNEAKRAVDRHLTQHCISALMGIGSDVYGTGADTSNTIITSQNEADIELFANNKHGAFYGASPSSGTRLYEYGEYSTTELNTLGTHYVASSVSGSATTEIALADVTNAIELMGAKGANPNTILVSPSHYKSLLNLADFTTAFQTSTSGVGYELFGGSDAQHLQSAAQSGVVGNLFGLTVVQNAWVPQGRFGIFDTSVKPMTYVERRGLTVEEANPGFGIVGSYMSMRYGMKIVRPEYGVIVYGA